MEQDKFLGAALKTPITIDEFGRSELVSGRDAVAQSIGRILSTPRGSIFHNRNFGSRLEEALIGEPNDNLVKSLAQLYVQEAIETHEKRVKFISIQFVFGRDMNPQNPNLINMFISYRILQSNEIDSLVYPFFRELNV